MPCRISKDERGTTYTIPADHKIKAVDGRSLRGTAEVTVWWMREFKNRKDETLIIRQENTHIVNGKPMADVIELTLGQVYDMIEALNHAVMKQ